MAGVARIWGDKADGAVQVFTVVPASETFDPGLRICLGCEALGRPLWAVFASSEQRL